jgi:aldehyde dehydrogenase (NAD+)
MASYTRFFVDGEWVVPKGEDALDVIHAATEETLARVPLAGPEDVDQAVHAARRAFEGDWGRTTPAERSAALRRLAAALNERSDAIAQAVTAEVGMPLKLSRRIQAGMPIKNAELFAKLTTEVAWEETLGHSLVLREPVGVVGAITPWNYPLHQMVAKVGAAVAAGCTVVLKPSEVAPLTAWILAEAVEEAELPPGVVNILVGRGPVAGEALVTHPEVDAVSFTGSVAAGTRVAALAAETVKRVTLELGGKSAFVLLDDADLDRAVPAGVKNLLLNSGQTCSAWSRMIVPRSKLSQVVDRARETMASFVLGDPFDPATTLGPLVSATQRDRVEGFLRQGREEGARLVTGGGRPDHPSRGYFIEPTLFADVTPEMTIAQEEIFGPVLSIMAYDETVPDDGDAVRLANATRYGLAGGVASGDEDRALRVARRMRTGQVDVNGGPFNPLAPFGGYKRSGVGRELGPHGLDEYLELKAIQRRPGR